MRFPILKAAISALAVCSTAVLAQITPAEVVDNINMLTTKSQALQAPAQDITIVNGPLIVVGEGPFLEIITGFDDIVTTAGVAIPQMQAMPKVPAGPQSDAIFDAFREFVRVHQVLLNILIGKAGLFRAVPVVGQPMAAILRQVEGVVDTIAFTLVDKVQSRSTDILSQADSLGQTLTLAINSYQGL